MFTRKFLAAVLIIVALVATMAPPIANAQQPSTYAALAVTGVTSGTSAVNSDFTTDVVASITVMNGPGAAGIEVFVGYDPTTVVPVDTNTSVPGIQPGEVRSDFFGTSTIPSANETLTGTACPGGGSCVHISMAGPAQTNRSSVIVGRLHWHGVAGGSAGFVLLNPVTVVPPSTSAPHTAMSDADGYLIPLNSATATQLTILVAGVNVGVGGIVNRQGVPPTAGGGTPGCTELDAWNGFGFVAGPAFTIVTPPPTLPAQVNMPGGFFLAVSNGGPYTIRAVYPGYLPSEKPNVFVSGGQVMIGSTKLYGGDVNGDNNINILDIVAIIGHMGQTGQAMRSSAGVCVTPIAGANGLPPLQVAPLDSVYDINDDSAVDISDLAIAAGNFGKVGPTVWAP